MLTAILLICTFVLFFAALLAVVFAGMQPSGERYYRALRNAFGVIVLCAISGGLTCATG